MERVLANIDADYSDCDVELLGHGVLLFFGAPCQLKKLAGQEHGRTIPLGDIGRGTHFAESLLIPWDVLSVPSDSKSLSSLD